MAIEKNSYKVSKIDLEVSPPNKRETNTMRSREEDDFPRRRAAVESEDDDEEEDFDDCDSGAGSDDVDLLELGESGEEFCRVGDQTCSVPFELYDLAGLQEVLSVDVWNEVLSEEERFSLSAYLPDMDQETCMRTLKDVLTGVNLHFGSPMDKLFEMLKGGLCEPRVELYRQGLMFFQRKQHYHLLRQYHNTMVSNICQIKDCWSNYKGYSIEEKLRVLNIMRSQKSLMNEKMEDVKSGDSSGKEGGGDGFWSKKVKDLKVGKKGAAAAQSGGGAMSSPLDVLSHASELPLATAKHGRQNQKHKTVMPKELVGSFPLVHQGVPINSVPYGSTLPRGAQHSKMVAYESGSRSRGKDQFVVDDDEGSMMYEVSVNRDQQFSRVDKRGTYKTGRNHEVLRGDDYMDSSMRLPRNDLYANGRNPPVNQLSDIKVLTSEPSSARSLYEFSRRAMNKGSFQPDDQIRQGKGKASKVSRKGNQMEIFDANEPYWQPGKFQGEPFAAVAKQSHHDHGDWNNKSNKGRMGRDSPDLRTNAQFFEVEHRGKALQESLRASSTKSRTKFKGSRVLEEADETESDSSKQSDEDEDDNPLMGKKWAYPRGTPELNSNQNFKKVNLAKKDSKAGMWAVDGSPHSSRHVPDFSEYQRKGKDGYLGWRAEQKGKMHDIGQHNSSIGDSDGDRYIGHGQMMFEHDMQQLYKLGRNSHHNEGGSMVERLHMPMFKGGGHSVDRGKREVGYEYGLPLDSLNHEEAHDSLPLQAWARDAMLSTRFGKKSSSQLRSDAAQLVGCNTLLKRRKLKDEIYSDEGDLKDYLLSVSQLQLQQTDNGDTSTQLVKNMLDHENSDSFGKAITETPTTDMEVEAVAQPDKKPKKKPFVLITPTNHTGFSFSIIHLLTSVRMSMISVVLPEDDSLEVVVGKNLDNKNEGTEIAAVQDVKEDTVVNDNKQTDAADGDVNMSAGGSSLSNLPSVTVQELVKRVRLKPYDPCVLETQEPLLDLVRGVLKIFSSRTAPGGAKGWKPLVVYEKSSKSWSWIGPVNSDSTEPESVEEMVSPDAWGLPHKMLVKLVDSFASWLKNAQEILQQIGSLPAPPSSLSQFNLDEKERFKELRAQKSLITITPSSEEVRDYFRKEEVLRYSIPDRAFFYTAIDGKRSIVAPLRRCGGKPTSKARDHFMLKRDRPPHVTILCLVRDAAARLPGSIGTRADVCLLIRDSQYIVEDVSDAQVNQVVSGALDRLHYERDPCVQFDGERKLWVYLHRERDEEDFEDDGTSSTKKWKRPRKDATDPVDQSPQASVPFIEPGEPGEPAGSYLKLEPFEDKKTEHVYGEPGEPAGSYPKLELFGPDEVVKTSEHVYGGDVLDVVENVMMETNLQAEEQESADHGGGSSPLIWDALPMHHPMQEAQLLCQENSTNDDFHHQLFGVEPPT